MIGKSAFSFVECAKLLAMTIFVALVMAGCSDGGTGDDFDGESGNPEDYAREVPSIYDLSRCTDEREGDTVYVRDKMRDYICINNSWVDISEPLNLPLSSSTATGEPDLPGEPVNSSDDSKPIVEESSSSFVSSSSVTIFPIGESSSSAALSSSSVQTHFIVENVYSLGVCDITKDGYTVYVSANGVTYVCEELVWSVYVTPNSSSSGMPVDDSFVPPYSEVASIMQLGVCDASSENARTLVMADTSYYVCQNGSWRHEGSHGFVVKNRSILGVAQKGPVMFGSPVYLRELFGDSLRFTGKVYVDEISSSKGDFVIPNVSLVYPYASVEVRGLYRNEVTGEYSKDSVSLYALTDLQTDSRTKVNVNLLTHLEYPRAMYLVRKGYSVYAAKRQADGEIMTAFELPTTIRYGEDLSVFEDSEDDNVDYANASLMMLNLLFLGNRTDAEFAETMENFIQDFEKDGEWNDSTTKAQMADFAKEVEGNTIRANVKAWNILDIPAFEEQLEMFWNNVYGLGGCTNVRKDVVAPNTNRFSENYDTYYKCDYSQHWVEATTVEKDTYGWEDGEDGELKKGDATDSVYVFEGGSWRAVKNEIEGVFGICSNLREGVVDELSGTYYICMSNEWQKATELEYDTYGWPAGQMGEVKKGSVTDAKYVYRNSKWNAASDVESNLGSCLSSDEGTVSKYSSTYYICKSSQWNAASDVESNLGSCLSSNAGTVSKYSSTYYICRSNEWQTTTTLEYDTYDWSAGQEGEVKKGSVTNAKYVYRNSKWNVASDVESNLGSCLSSGEGTVSKYSSTYYICKSNEWKDDTYGLSCSHEGTIVGGKVVPTNKYVCDADTFRAATNDEIALNLGCTSYTQNQTKTQEDEWNKISWLCSSMWTETERTFKYGSLTDTRGDTTKTYKTVKIGDQIWMAENLNYAYNKGSATSYCYENSADSCAKYGRLYTWVAAIDSVALSASGKTCGYGKTCTLPSVVQGVCPDGWHLPSTAEWDSLFTKVGGESTAGRMLRSTSGWSYVNGNDTYGFSALPAGYRADDGNFRDAGVDANFWSSSESFYSDAYYEYFNYNYSSVYEKSGRKYIAFSVRCLRDSN